MSISVIQLEHHVIRPTLAFVSSGELPGFASDGAVELLLGTAAAESQFRFLDQVTTTEATDRTWGPAYGLWQMERTTHDDIFTSFLDAPGRKRLKARVLDLRAAAPDPVIQLATNLAYAVALVRLRYWRMSERLPAAGDLDAQAAYWKRHYNTPQGKGTTDKYVRDYLRLVGPHRTGSSR